MGQSSSATSSHASSNHSPSSPGPRRPAPHPQPPGGYGGQDRRYGDSRGSGPPYSEGQDRLGQNTKRLSASSVSNELKPTTSYERPAMPLPSGSSSNSNINQRPPSTSSDLNLRTSLESHGQTDASRVAASRLQGQGPPSGPGPRGRPPSAHRDSLEMGAISINNSIRTGPLPPESASAVAHQASQMALKANPKWRDSLVSEEGNYSPSISSSRSVTPPLPPLSPDNTPPQSPPGSPGLSRHTAAQHQYNPPGFLARTPDVVTSTAKKPVVNGKKKANRRTAGGASVGVKTWDGRAKRTTVGRNGKRGPSSRPPRPPSGKFEKREGK